MIQVRLECGHHLYWRTVSHAPKTGERTWCDHDDCKDMRVIVSRTGEWTVHCKGCRWHKSYVRMETMRDRVIEHIRDCGNPVVAQNHDRTESYTVRTPHAAADMGTHPASMSAERKVGSPIPPSNTLF